MDVHIVTLLFDTVDSDLLRSVINVVRQVIINSSQTYICLRGTPHFRKKPGCLCYACDARPGLDPFSCFSHERWPGGYLQPFETDHQVEMVRNILELNLYTSDVVSPLDNPPPQVSINSEEAGYKLNISVQLYFNHQPLLLCFNVSLIFLSLESRCIVTIGRTLLQSFPDLLWRANWLALLAVGSCDDSAQGFSRAAAKVVFKTHFLKQGLLKGFF